MFARSSLEADNIAEYAYHHRHRLSRRLDVGCFGSMGLNTPVIIAYFWVYAMPSLSLTCHRCYHASHFVYCRHFIYYGSVSCTHLSLRQRGTHACR